MGIDVEFDFAFFTWEQQQRGGRIVICKKVYPNFIRETRKSVYEGKFVGKASLSIAKLAIQMIYLDVFRA